MAQFLAIQTHTIVTATSVANNAMPQCSFTTRLAGKRVAVVANVDNGPSPYFILERTIVEATQVFAPAKPGPEPVPIPLGLEAAWFPAGTDLEATDGTLLITTSVDWQGVARKRKIALATAVTRVYLKTPRGKRAQALAKGYPSG